jgi:hypothetical protein
MDWPRQLFRAMRRSLRGVVRVAGALIRHFLTFVWTPQFGTLVTAIATVILAYVTFSLVRLTSEQTKASIQPAVTVALSRLLSPALTTREGQLAVVVHNHGPIELRSVSIEPAYYTLRNDWELAHRFPSKSRVRVETPRLVASAVFDRQLNLTADLLQLTQEFRIVPEIICVRVEFRHELTNVANLIIECAIRGSVTGVRGVIYMPFGGSAGLGGPLMEWRKRNRVLAEIRSFENSGQ